MNFSTFLCLFLFFTGCSNNSPANSSPLQNDQKPGEIAFSDTSLEFTVRKILNKTNGILSSEDFLSITSLSAPNRKIQDLGGIGQLKNLTTLDLSGNKIGEVDSLAPLVKLTFLDVENNQIKDLSPLVGLKNLTHLAISFNRVIDISPLLGLKHLTSLELTGNPLEVMAVSHIVQLRQQGVYVNFEDQSVSDEPSTDTNSSGTGSSDSNSLDGIIVFDSNKSGTWKTFLLKGVTEICLTEDSTGDKEPDLSPDGSRIALHGQRNGETGIYLMDSHGEKSVSLTSSGKHPAWSPEGEWIAYVIGVSLYIIGSDITNNTRLTSFDEEGIIFQKPVWSPDGRKIAFLVQVQREMRIYVVDLEADNAMYLIHDSALAWSIIPSQGRPSWSPDGSRITFVAAENDQLDVFTANADGSDRVNLTHNPIREYGTAWSPDGQKIAFISELDGESEIYVMETDGSNIVRLTHSDSGPERPKTLRWSPDGRDIAFLSSYGLDQVQLELMHADGTGRIILTDSAVLSTVFSWR